MLFGPWSQQFADIFRSVIDTNYLGFAEPFDDLVHVALHRGHKEREAHFTVRSFTIEVIKYVQRAELPSICQLIHHKVHAPTLVWCIWRSQFIGFGPFQKFLGFGPQAQLQLIVNFLNPFVLPYKPLDITQVKEAKPKTPRVTIAHQTHQPIRDFNALVMELSFLSVEGLTDLKAATRESNADPVFCHRLLSIFQNQHDLSITKFTIFHPNFSRSFLREKFYF